MIATVAVDMRIGQLVDEPKVGVTAILPLDIFVGRNWRFFLRVVPVGRR